MQSQRTTTYDPPRVLTWTMVQTEADFLFGSVVDSLNAGGIFTTPLAIEEKDFDTDDFNFKWE